MPLKDLTSPYAPWLLNALQFQGRSNDCGPYTTATVLNALTGSEINGIELANQMDKPVWRGPLFVVHRVPNWATFPWGIVDIFRSSGLEAGWQQFSSINQLTSALRGGRCYAHHRVLETFMGACPEKCLLVIYLRKI